jgi:glycosyltransferase involved in cell wall biosynthesis
MSGRVFHLLERWLMGQTAAIIFESRYAQSTYTQLIGAPTCPTEVIYNGLQPDEFAGVVPLPNAADFVFVGELRDLKGIHVLVEALSGLVHRDGRPARLVMAGDGGARQALVTQIAALGLSDRVTLLGAQPARPSFAKGRVAVVPSLAESLPYIVLEAAAAELPVIATRVGGIPEIFGPTAASLIAPNDVAALRTAMQAALDHPEIAAAEMRQRLSYIAEHFAVDTMVGAIEALYLNAVATA